DQAFYDFLGGKEVVLVSTLAATVESHHRTGQAFDLFTDLVIQPYGLRCLEAPRSLYPERPASGFIESLDHCLEEIEALYQQRPFEVFAVAAGAYSLPLCEVVQQRYGVSCLSIGPSLHARFGVLEAGTSQWRLEQRRPENWIQAELVGLHT
ncbi:MAG: hypothetical protein WBM08_06470, partial [Prochlorococcaceae cyanobacterium]